MDAAEEPQQNKFIQSMREGDIEKSIQSYLDFISKKADSRIKKLYVTIDKKFIHYNQQMEARFNGWDSSIETNKNSIQELFELLKQTQAGQANTGKVKDGKRSRMKEDSKVNEALKSMKAEIDGITNQLKQFYLQVSVAPRSESLQSLEEKMNRELGSLQDQMNSKWPLFDQIPQLEDKLKKTKKKIKELATHKVHLVQEIKLPEGGQYQSQNPEHLQNLEQKVKQMNAKIEELAAEFGKFKTKTSCELEQIKRN